MAESDVDRTADFARVVVEVDEVEARGQLAREGRMPRVHAGIEHGHAHAGAGRDALRLRQVHRLWRPLRREFLRGADGPDDVLARLRTFVHEVRLREQHGGLRAQSIDRVVHACGASHPEAVDRPCAEAVDQAELIFVEQGLERGRRAQFDQHLSGEPGVAAGRRMGTDTGGQQRGGERGSQGASRARG